MMTMRIARHRLLPASHWRRMAAHGGEVSLVEVTGDNYAVLQFGGGCQGCSAVDITLKNGVERSLMDQLPHRMEQDEQ